MITYLNRSHSLFHESEQQLPEFKRLGLKWNEQLEPLDTYIHNPLDSYAAMYNLWVSLNQNVHSAVLDSKKLFSHSSTLYVFSLIERDARIQAYLRENRQNADAIYLLSYFLSNNILKWIYLVLKENEENQILEDCRRYNYFKLLDPEQPPTSKGEQLYYTNQKIITSLIARDFQKRKRFQYCVEHSVARCEVILLAPSL